MQIIDILEDRSLRAKAKAVSVGKLILSGKVSNKELIAAAQKASPVNKANLVEGMQLATEKDPSFANKELFIWLCKCLEDETDRVKWEAARSLTNIIPMLPALSPKALNGALINTEHKGTVVRWSAAKLLAAIYVNHVKSREELSPVIEAIILRETDNAIKKIYLKILTAKSLRR